MFSIPKMFRNMHPDPFKAPPEFLRLMSTLRSHFRALKCNKLNVLGQNRSRDPNNWPPGPNRSFRIPQRGQKPRYFIMYFGYIVLGHCIHRVGETVCPYATFYKAYTPPKLKLGVSGKRFEFPGEGFCQNLKIRKNTFA